DPARAGSGYSVRVPAAPRRAGHGPAPDGRRTVRASGPLAGRAQRGMKSCAAISRTRGDLPRVAAFVLHYAATVSVKHDGWRIDPARTGFQGTPIRLVPVVDMDVDKGGRRIPSPGLTDHGHGVADTDLGWAGPA